MQLVHKIKESNDIDRDFDFDRVIKKDQRGLGSIAISCDVVSRRIYLASHIRRICHCCGWAATKPVASSAV